MGVLGKQLSDFPAPFFVWQELITNRGQMRKIFGATLVTTRIWTGGGKILGGLVLVPGPGQQLSNTLIPGNFVYPLELLSVEGGHDAKLVFKERRVFRQMGKIAGAGYLE